MNIYPGMRARMGRWDYFIVKMNMRELDESVQFATDVYEDQTLGEALQRVLDDRRVKKSIVTYLSRQEDRFFSSIVIAALDGNPKWFPVAIDADPQFAIFAADQRLNDTFGVLTFDGTQRYYALDGQHRLSAIKNLLHGDVEDAFVPEGFANEEMSVLVVVPTEISGEIEKEEEFRERFRRLFGHLNRYAKPMDKATNIVMDEDDAVAIVTRRLITEHELFKSSGRERDSQRVNTGKRQTMKSDDPHFTTISHLYQMNVELLNSPERADAAVGWSPEAPKFEEFITLRPDDEVLDELYIELKTYWDALIAVIPELRLVPSDHRVHDGTGPDLALFWPITQVLLAQLARMLINRARDASQMEVEVALAPLGSIDWELHSAPWRHLVLVGQSGGWSMRSEERKIAVDYAKVLLLWQMGLVEYTAEDIQRIRSGWEELLTIRPRDSDIEELWQAIEDGVQR